MVCIKPSNTLINILSLVCRLSVIGLTPGANKSLKKKISLVLFLKTIWNLYKPVRGSLEADSYIKSVSC